MKSFSKWLPWIVIGGILVVMMGLFVSFSNPESPAENTLERASKVSDRMWLYEIKHQNAGNTAPTRYRFYLAGELSGGENEIVKYLEEESPFLTGTGTLSEIREEANNQVLVTYTGPVVSLSHKTVYQDGKQQITVNLSYRLN